MYHLFSEQTNPQVQKLAGSLIGLARATDCNALVASKTWQILAEGLSLTIPDRRCSDESLGLMISRVQAEKKRLVPDCSTCAAPCSRNADYVIADLFRSDEEVVSLKLQILAAIQQLAVFSLPAIKENSAPDSIGFFLAKGLFCLGENWSAEELLSVLTEAEELLSTSSR